MTRNEKKNISCIVRKAVISGAIIKPNKCERCKKIFPKHSIHGHHDDYSKPFKVRWLCNLCHKKVEFENGNIVAYEAGENHRGAKLTLKNVEDIRERFENGETIRQIRSIYPQVGRHCLWDIINYRRWNAPKKDLVKILPS
jgi:hypothetical protein